MRRTSSLRRRPSKRLGMFTRHRHPQLTRPITSPRSSDEPRNARRHERRIPQAGKSCPRKQGPCGTEADGGLIKGKTVTGVDALRLLTWRRCTKAAMLNGQAWSRSTRYHKAESAESLESLESLALCLRRLTMLTSPALCSTSSAAPLFGVEEGGG